MLDNEVLIPTVAQDARTGQVLMLAYSNRESLRRTLETGEAHYWSRSRNRLWKKGETSGNVQRFVSASLDCDADTLLFQVEPAGPACHTGAVSCFFTPVREASALASGEGGERRGSLQGETGPQAPGGRVWPDAAGTAPQSPVSPCGDVFARLFEVIESRRRDRPEGSYTARLLEHGVDRISRKIAEEAGEVIIAAKNQSREELLWEAADLIYHLMVLLASQQVSWGELGAELEKRRK